MMAAGFQDDDAQDLNGREVGEKGLEEVVSFLRAIGSCYAIFLSSWQFILSLLVSTSSL